MMCDQLAYMLDVFEPSSQDAFHVFEKDTVKLAAWLAQCQSRYGLDSIKGYPQAQFLYSCIVAAEAEEDEEVLAKLHAKKSRWSREGTAIHPDEFTGASTGDESKMDDGNLFETAPLDHLYPPHHLRDVGSTRQGPTLVAGDSGCLLYTAKNYKHSLKHQLADSEDGPWKLGMTQEAFARLLDTPVGTVRGWEAMHRRFGRASWKDIFSASIHYSGEGFPVTESISSE
jgi:hypothetical protein